MEARRAPLPQAAPAKSDWDILRDNFRWGARGCSAAQRSDTIRHTTREKDARTQRRDRTASAEAAVAAIDKIETGSAACAEDAGAAAAAARPLGKSLRAAAIAVAVAAVLARAAAVTEARSTVRTKARRAIAMSIHASWL